MKGRAHVHARAHISAHDIISMPHQNGGAEAIARAAGGDLLRETTGAASA